MSFSSNSKASFGKSFVTATEAEDARRLREEKYCKLGHDPPLEDGNDSRPLSERLAEQRRLKEEAEEEQLRLANQVHKLDEDEIEFLNDVRDAERLTQEMNWEEEKRALAQFRRDREALDVSNTDSAPGEAARGSKPMRGSDAAGPSSMLLAALRETNGQKGPRPMLSANALPELKVSSKPHARVDIQRRVLAGGVIVNPGAKKRAGSESQAVIDSKRVRHCAHVDPCGNAVCDSSSMRGAAGQSFVPPLVSLGVKTAHGSALSTSPPLLLAKKDRPLAVALVRYVSDEGSSDNEEDNEE